MQPVTISWWLKYRSLVKSWSCRC